MPFLQDEKNIHINGAIVVFLFILALSLAANRLIKNKLEHHLVPSPRFSLVGFVDLLIEGLYGMITGVLGKTGDKYFPFIAAIFLFVLFSNLLGLLPHSAAPTANISTNLALGLAAFAYYNLMGVKEHGIVGYLKHFLMGMGLFGIPIALLELISHVIRPFSLSIRLYVNMFVDHTVVLSFQNLIAWLLPVPLLLFGIVVCLIQAFVFATLTSVYVQMATEHEEGHGEHH